jgi:sugar phosphate isomerase/epimerase
MLPLTYCYHWHRLSGEELEAAMRAFADSGARHLVLTSDLICEGCRDSEYLFAFHRRMREFGLDFVDSHAPWGTWSDPGMPVAERRELMLLKHRMAFQFCRRFGVRTMAFHTGNTRNSVFGARLTLEDYRRALIESLELLLPEAERCGVVIALENQWTPLNHSDELLKIMESFHSPQLGLCFDSGHANLMEKGARFPGKTCVPPIWDDLGVPVKWEERVAERFAPWMVDCHLHDNGGIDDEHRFPGQGTIDWDRVRNVLRHAPRLQSMQNESVPRESSVSDFCRVFQELLKDFQ